MRLKEEAWFKKKEEAFGLSTRARALQTCQVTYQVVQVHYCADDHHILGTLLHFPFNPRGGAYCLAKLGVENTREK